MDTLSVKDINVKSKRIFVRVDFNVPMDEDKGIITDDSRIRAALPTIRYLVDEGARVILCSHLGRPKGIDDKLRMKPVAERLSQILGKKVLTVRDSIGPEVEKSVSALHDGDVLMLENIRFYAEEEKNDDAFAQKLARLADIYVDDAFGTTHRAHASISGIAKYLPAVAGLLLERELVFLGQVQENPAKPFAALLGGAKISDKVAMLHNILAKTDYLLIGGGMAATFLKARGVEIGLSLLEKDMLETAGDIMRQAEKNRVELVLPVDVVLTDSIGPEARVVETRKVDRIPPELRIVDIGPQTIKTFQEKLNHCHTIFWNGPMGIYEVPRFAEGTHKMARYLAGSKATTIVGGGSTSDVVYDMGLGDKITFVSTGGGASLSFLSGEPLPGVTALLNRKTATPEQLKGLLKTTK
jgi:phosphoglycerate kinase